MTKVEEQVLKAYPRATRDIGGIVVDIGHPQYMRDIYIEGYNQALKDIWHNVKDETPIDGERLLLINRNGEYGTTMIMMPILHKEFHKWEKWAYIKDLIPSK